MANIKTTNGGAYQIDKAIFIQNESGGYFNNGGFFVAFTSAIREIATNKELSKLDQNLLLLILSYMGVKEMMIEPNVQRLLGVSDYAEELGYSRRNKGHIASSFKKLENMGFFKRDKKRKDLHILINPAMAYNGKTKEYTQVWNRLALPFGNTERKQKQPKTEEEESQDWNSHVLEDLNADDDFENHRLFTT